LDGEKLIQVKKLTEEAFLSRLDAKAIPNNIFEKEEEKKDEKKKVNNFILFLKKINNN
jgi:hypothetical protein